MGKESELLKAAENGDIPKMERLLTSPKRKGASVDANPLDLSGDLQSMRMKRRVTHINVDCTDHRGATPLILAALNGHKEAVVLLLIYSATIHHRDDKDNSAIHMAAWNNRSDVVEILLKNGAKVNEVNVDGNSPLHFAAEFYQGNIFTPLKLLQNGAKVMVKNAAGDTPLDLAARFDKKECLSLLVDSDVTAIQSTRSIVEASKTGRKDIVQLLINCGMGANAEADQTRPLNEACRYFRKDIVELLLTYGANPDISNGKGETSRALVESYCASKGTEEKAKEIIALFEEYKDKEPLTPQAEQDRLRAEEKRNAQTQEVVMKDYPILKNKIRWTEDSEEYRSGCTLRSPNTNLLDDNPETFWVSPSTTFSWVSFDFGSPFTLTGIRIIGWANDQMLKHFEIQTGITLTGPWTVVKKFQAHRVGSSDPVKPGEAQDFKEFYASSQYWRLLITDNYGGPCTCFQGIQFFGFDTMLRKWFNDLGLIRYYEDFAMKGYNQVSELVRVTDRELEIISSLPGHRKKIALAVKKMREHVYPLRELKWDKHPVLSCIEGDEIPPFSVQGDPMTNEDLRLVVHGGAKLSGNLTSSLEPNGDNPSTAEFKGISLTPAGRYLLEVQSVKRPDKFVRATDPIVVAFPTKNTVELDAVFGQLDDMLKF